MAFMESSGTWLPKAAGDTNKTKSFEDEQALIDEAQAAGYATAQEYLDAKRALGQEMQAGKTAMSQMAARSLLGAMPFGGAGGAPLMGAAATGLASEAARAQLGMTGVEQMAGLGAMGQQAQQAAAEYAISAQPDVRRQQKLLGHMQTFFDLRKSLSKEDSMAAMRPLLATETDPAVIDMVNDFMFGSED